MIYLAFKDTLYIHEEQIRLFGGAIGVRDLGMIEVAPLPPPTGYYGDLIEEASVLWEILTINHGDVDGNKRVAFARMDIFLALDDHMLIAEREDVIAFIYANLASKSFDEATLEP